MPMRIYMVPLMTIKTMIYTTESHLINLHSFWLPFDIFPTWSHKDERIGRFDLVILKQSSSGFKINENLPSMRNGGQKPQIHHLHQLQQNSLLPMHH